MTTSRPALMLATILALLAGDRASAQDCSPRMDCSLKVDNRDCTPVDKRDCSLKTDTRDCSFNEDTRSCGHDVNLGLGKVHVNDPVCEAAKAAENVRRRAAIPACEAAKAAQNLAYAGEKQACEAAKAAQNAAYLAARPACEQAKAAQNALYAGEKAACEANKTALKVKCEADKADFARKATSLARKMSSEATTMGLKALPSDVRRGVQHLSDQAKAEINKYPVVSGVLISVLRVSNPMLAGELDAILKSDCDPQGVLDKLSSGPQSGVNTAGKNLGALTTPLKDGGISGWIATGCWAEGEGVLVRDAAHSSDKLFTIDVRLTQFSVESRPFSGDRYLRIEVEPGGGAHQYASSHPLLRQGDRIRFAGPVLIDTDPPTFLEVHPIDDLSKR